MSDAENIRAFAAKGVVIDTNILLLLFVGRLDRNRVGDFKRTEQFAPEHYDLLERLLRQFARIITTPNIVTEVSNFLGQLNTRSGTTPFQRFARDIETIDERYLSSKDLSTHDDMVAFGLTDTAIARLAEADLLILTDDWRLGGTLQKRGLAVINFNHIRFTNFRSSL